MCIYICIYIYIYIYGYRETSMRFFLAKYTMMKNATGVFFQMLLYLEQLLNLPIYLNK